MIGVTFIGPDTQIASGRLRAQIPWGWLSSNGYQSGTDVLVVSKHDWPKDFTRGFDYYIFDVCDDHFQTENADHYLFHCERADLVTCNSDAMAERVKDITGRDAVVIPDPFEYDRKPPHLGHLLWFGAKWNLPHLQRVIPYLPDVPLEVVSEPVNDLITPWSPEAVQKAMEEAGIVLIPIGKRKTKSANRMVEAINQGCFVVAEDMPAHEAFHPFAWIGDIGEGVRWALEHPDEVLGAISMGQDYIDSCYSMDAIGPLWAEAIDGIG